MSAPVQELDDNPPSDAGSSSGGPSGGGAPSNDGPLNYAPKRARPEENQTPESAPSQAVISTASPPDTSESPEPPWRRKKLRGLFTGDLAVVELGNRLTLAPDRVPEPPSPNFTTQLFGAIVRIAAVLAVAAMGAVGYLWHSVPQNIPPSRPPPPATDGSNLAPERSVSVANFRALDAKPAMPPAASGLAREAASETTRSVTTSVAAAPRTPAPFSVQDSRVPVLGPPQLTVNAGRLRQANEPARLTISAVDAGTDAAVVISGLAPGSTLSAGKPMGGDAWRLSSTEFNDAAITPPAGFVGAMKLTFELRRANDTVADRKSLQLEWSGNRVAAPANALPSGSSPEIALMVKNGAALMANEDIAAARLMFQRAAEAGDADAAFALAETYDPLVLNKLGRKGGITIRSDVARAQSWYARARDLGSTLAPERLVRLSQLPE